ncbi:hypothetical protein BGZ49_010636 [Haplosporangium sp. Z 27]|nr:hypothetical protein BGZ49_010636 [Haplosporangium sp. Z 27]
MFFPWSLFTLNIILSIFTGLLIAALDAVLAIYSKAGGEYTSTIRWSRRGGYLESFKILWNSWSTRNTPKSAWRTMLLVTIVSIVLLFVDKLASINIHPTTSQSRSSQSELITSPQIIFSRIPSTFQRWATTVRYGDDITAAMTLLINDTTNIPNFDNNRIYIPQTSDYEVECDQVSLQFMYTDKSIFTLPAGTCATVTINTGGISPPPYQLGNITTLSRGRYSYAFPAVSFNSSFISEFAVQTSYSYSNQIKCFIMEDDPVAISYPKDGFTSAPQTTTIKCVDQNGAIAVLSSSSIKFMSSSYQQFRNVTSMVLSEDDELVQAMVSAMSLSEATSIPAVLVEIKIVNSTIDILMCYSAGTVFTANLMQICSYNTVQLVLTTQQEINPVISKARGGSPLSSSLVYSLWSHITQIPTMVNGTHLPVIPLSFQALKNATSDISHYMATLGQNAYMDWEQHAFFVLYDTSKIVQGLEVPVWIVISFGVITTMCIALLVYARSNLEEYQGSLYFNISQQLSQVEKDKSFKAPMLMSFKKDTKELGGYPIVSQEAGNDSDDETLGATTPSQVSLNTL